MATRQNLTVLLGAVLLAGSLTARYSSTNPDEEAVSAAAVRDLYIGVAPLIPCTNGQAQYLTAQTVQAQQRKLASFYQETYASSEPTHVALLAQQRQVIAAAGPGGANAATGELLCEPSGGIDQVQVLAFTISGPTAQITLQAHEWNETMGIGTDGTPFHFRPESVIRVTDNATTINGQWLISQRGQGTFMSGAP